MSSRSKVRPPPRGGGVPPPRGGKKVAPPSARQALSAAAWEKQGCLEEGEARGARSLVHVQHALKPLWAQPLSLTENACNAGAGETLVMRDGSVWIRRDHELDMLDM